MAEPVSEALDFAQWWVKPKIDFAKLAKLRESGLTFLEIAARLGRGKTSLYRTFYNYSYTMLKGLSRTDNWENPLVCGRPAAKKSKGYQR